LRAQHFIRTQELHKAEEQDCGKTSESKVEANTPSHDTPLEGNHGVLQDESFGNEEWHVAVAKNLEEEKKLIEVGFEFVRYSERDGVAIYRKRK